MVRLPLVNRFVLTHKQLKPFLKTFKHRPILDYVSEFTNDTTKTKQIIKDTLIENPNIHMAIKLSALGLNQSSGNTNMTYYNTEEIVNCAIDNSSKILIDAETCKLQPKINKISDELMLKYNSENSINVFKTYQMYRKDSFNCLREDINCFGKKLGVKLVRGAYWNAEYNSGELHTEKIDTDTDYEMAFRILLNEINTDNFIFATHNHKNIDSIIKISREKPNIACLLGMNDQKIKSICDKSNIYRYIPFGTVKESVPYLLRRLNENLDITQYLIK